MICKINGHNATPCEVMAVLHDMVEAGWFTLSHARSLMRFVVQDRADLILATSEGYIYVRR